MPKPFLFLFIFFSSCISWSQDQKAFQLKYSNYLKGDITYIANAIVGKKSGKTANEAYNKISSSAKLNDQLTMLYIDIDEDTNTYSSSEATLVKNQDNAKIVFAGLYWSATLPEEERNTTKPINEILFKTPATTQYTPLKGEIIFDTQQHSRYKANCPYLCYANVTELIKNNPWGAYTVANIQASQKKIEGGSAGGWVLYIVYESVTMPYHFISLYDGFSYIYDQPEDFSFKDFKTPKQPKTTPKLLLAALEGDFNLEGDNLRFKTSKSTKWNYFNTPLRNSQNIFNSKISYLNSDFINRNPASLNTLGFDVFLETLDFKEQNLNEIEEINLKISSNGDKFYINNVGFSIEVDSLFAEQKISALTPKKIKQQTPIAQNIPENKPSKKTNTYTKNTINNKNIIVPKRITKEIKTFYFDKNKVPEGYYIIANANQNKLYAEEYLKKINNKQLKPILFKNPENQFYYLSIQHYKTEESAKKAYFNNINQSYFQDYWIAKIINNEQEIATIYKTKPRAEKELAILKTTETNIKKGYYLVANVFEIPSNASNYLNFLRSKKITANSFINPLNQYHYVYLAYYDTLVAAKNAYFSNFNGLFFDEYWLMEVVYE